MLEIVYYVSRNRGLIVFGRAIRWFRITRLATDRLGRPMNMHVSCFHHLYHQPVFPIDLIPSRAIFSPSVYSCVPQNGRSFDEFCRSLVTNLKMKHSSVWIKLLGMTCFYWFEVIWYIHAPFSRHRCPLACLKMAARLTRSLREYCYEFKDEILFCMN